MSPLCGTNMEDIKAPECFYIEKQLCERMSIQVFHDDQGRKQRRMYKTGSTPLEWRTAATRRERSLTRE